MEDKTYTYIFYDMLEKVLQLSENPSRFGEFLTQQIRELIGAKTVVIAIKSETDEAQIFNVYPPRRTEWCNQPTVINLAAVSFNYSTIQYLSNENADNTIADILASLEIEKAIAIPLIVGNRTVGTILLLDIMDLFGINEVIDLLTRLSGVFALIIRNAILYQNLENAVVLRTAELLQRNKELQERELELKAANEEFETLNEELTENIKKAVQTNDLLEKAKQKAEENDRLKTAFLQNMSHEIRTPMNAILGFTDFLGNPNLSHEKRTGFTAIIQNSTHQLLSIVTNILTISSLETKQEKLSIAKVCINCIIVEQLAVFKSQATVKNLSLYAKQQLPDKQSYIFTDQTKITQILTNLITNALKFTHTGYIEFGYKLVDTLRGESLQSEMEFYVKDTGIGIEQSKLTSIFERFVQADKTIQVNYGGTGLGLSISKGFVDLLGGKIWVESNVNQGSTFYFSIPYKPVEPAHINHWSVNRHVSKTTILIAEDDEFNSLFLEELLNNYQFNLLYAKNGKEALDICRTNQPIDLILMDIKMPYLNGHEAAIQIKHHRPDVIIIAQSAYALEHEIEQYKGSCFDDYITKPIKEAELKQKVMKYLSMLPK